jgi:hypothetical protein
MRIRRHALVSFLSMVTAEPGLPAAISAPFWSIRISLSSAICTTAHGSMVSVAEMIRSYGSLCGLAVAVHVSFVVMLLR